MSKYHMLSLLTFFLLLFVPIHSAQAQETLPGLQYSCLSANWCIEDGAECSNKHVHRVQLTTDDEFKAAPSSSEAYVTECLELVNATTNTPETICTTGSSDLDKDLFCGPDNPDPAACDFYTELKNAAGYKLSGDSYGVYYYNEATQSFEKKDPTTIATDAQGNIIPSQIEWQSRTDKNTERRYLVWSRVREDVGTLDSVDPGQKQATLSFPTLSEMCQGLSWDPEGIVYDAQTGVPLGNVGLSINYSKTASGPFTPATSGLDAVLPPGTENPLMTTAAGFYRFYGAEGYYTMTPQHAVYQHMNDKQISIPAAVSKVYPAAKNYYADSSPIFEKAGVRQIKNIPLMLKAGQARPPFVFQVLSSVINSNPRGEVQIAGRVNAPATLVLEICSNLSGIPNCRNKKEYAPGNGGPSPDNNFSYNLTAKQSELQPGENYKVSFVPLTVTNTQSYVPSLMKNLQSLLGLFIPAVSAQESTAVSFTVEPVPTYLEGFAYDKNGNTIPNAVVSVYVSFSPRPVYQTTANSNGFFRITSERLPRDPYTVKYTSVDGTETALTTSQFLAQNNEFMIVEKVNPYVYVTQGDNPRAEVTPTFQPRQAVAIADAPDTGDTTVQVSPTPSAESPVQTNNNVLFYIFALIIGVAVLGIVATVYFMKKRSSTVV